MKHHGLRFGPHNLGGLRPKSPPRKQDPDAPLTDAQRRALRLASHKRGAKAGAEIVRARTATGAHVTNAMATKLEARGWATRVDDMLVITDEGRAQLRAAIPETPAVFLHRRDGLTPRRDQGLTDEGEVIDPATLEGFWEEDAERRLAATRDRREKARSRKYAADRHKRAA